jgi:PAS domain S-box-containing protein
VSSLQKKTSPDQCLKDGESCWLVSRTHCFNPTSADFVESLGTCLDCEYFKKRGALHPKGLNFFIAEQFQNCLKRELEQKTLHEKSLIETLDRIPDGVCTFDTDWRINYFNPAAEKIIGVQSEDVIGMHYDDVFNISGNGRGKDLRKAINDGADVHNREHEIVDIDGQIKAVICSTSSFRNDEGEITGGVSICKDITELITLKDQVVRREKKYSRIFEGSHDMIYTSRQDGKLLNVNNAGVEMLGFSSKEEMLGIDSVSRFYVNPEDRFKLVTLFSRNGNVKDLVFNWVRVDGTPIFVLMSGRSYEDPKTGEVQYEGIIKDITRRKEIEELIQKRNRELSVLNGIALAVNYTMGLDNILKVTLRRILSGLSLSQGGIFLIDRIEKETTLQAVYGLPCVEKGTSVELIFKNTLLRESLIEKASRLSLEAFFPSFHACYNHRDEGSPLWLSCHLIISKGQPVGFFGFVLPPGRILDHQENRLLDSLGNFLGNAIENVRMIETIHQNRHDLQRLTRQLFQTQDDERRHLARELHDETGQSLTAVKLGLDHLEQKIPKENTPLRDILTDTRKMLLRTSSEIRRLAYHLHPTLLTDLGLEPALKLYFKDIENHSNLNIEFQMIGFKSRLEKDLETSLYRFSQEALTNTLKHSGAETFKLKIIKSFPKIIFIAEDDGVGFNDKNALNDKRSMGLLGMRERTHLLGGKFLVKGRLGHGARIRIEIKIPEDYETFTEGLKEGV